MRQISMLLTASLLLVGVPVAAQNVADDVTPQARAAAADNLRVARGAIRLTAARGLSGPEMARTMPRIVNGEPERQGGQWAWTVSILLDDKHHCGGALVAPVIARTSSGNPYVSDWVVRQSDLTWVITAAHCVTDVLGNTIERNRLTVRGGTLTTENMHRTGHTINKMLAHEFYSPTNFDNDVALLRISEPISALDPSVRRTSIRLPSDLDQLWLYNPYAAMTVHGWGRTSEGGPLSSYLQKVTVPHVDKQVCAIAYASLGYDLSDSMFCSGFSTGGYDSCQGDSGGPTVFLPTAGGVVNPVNEPVLAGVVSWGHGCARQNLYGVYTNLLKMRPWLEEAAIALSN